jgi:hypothetical protein
MPGVTQAEFARQLGVDRSHVTRLKQAGRLVMTPEGLVDADASRALIAGTVDPNRDDVAARHAAARSAKVSPGGTAPPAAPPTPEDKVGNNFQAARAVKEKYLALDAKVSYEQRIGQLIPRADVEQALDDLVAAVRAGVENLPHRIAAQLVGKDLDTVRALLKQEIGGIMAEMHGGARKRLAELTQEAG